MSTHGQATSGIHAQQQIKSERDITIDAMVDVGFSYGASTRSTMATLYDLGYRKT